MIKENLLTLCVEKWAKISSTSHDEKGLQDMLSALKSDFSLLNPDTCSTLHGKILHLTKRKKAEVQILFGGHMDTVFSPHKCPVIKKSENILQGAGVTDMKGGLVVMLMGLHEFEKEKCSQEIGWEIFINPDEEIGSPLSKPIIEECGKRCDIALLFEPRFPDGKLVSARKGSVTYFIHSKGKTAHVGRDFQSGKSAIYPLARLITKIEELHAKRPQSIINVGLISGGEAANVVPGRAELTVNVRAWKRHEMEEIDRELRDLAKAENLEVEVRSWSDPKEFDTETKRLFQCLKECGKELGQEIEWKETGGVCDGNTLSHLGLPCIDTMGVTGGMLHTEEEYIELDSLNRNKDLLVCFLRAIAERKIEIHKRKKC